MHLEGRYLTTYRELAHNEFLEEPYERLVEPGDSSVQFTLTGTPDDDDVIAVNVIAYVTSGTPEESYFVRRRVELPLIHSAAARSSVQASNSSWGKNGSIQLGDRAPTLSLPQADGTEVQIDDVRGDGNLIVTTYRAFW